MLKKINPFKKKVDTTSTKNSHQQAVVALSEAKRLENRHSYIRIKVSNGYILVARDKYRRKKIYYHAKFGEQNIIL